MKTKGGFVDSSLRTNWDTSKSPLDQAATVLYMAADLIYIFNIFTLWQFNI